MNIHSYTNDATLSHELALAVLHTAQQCIAEHGQFSIAVSSGPISTQLFQNIGSIASDLLENEPSAITDFWQHWLIFMTHENVVSMDSPACQYKTLAENWLAKVDIPLNHVFPMVTEVDDIDACVADYRSTLVDYLNLDSTGTPQLDLILLEVDEQNHIAALYPGSPGITDHAQSVEAVSDTPSGVAAITLSLPLMLSARQIYLIGGGADKNPAPESTDIAINRLCTMRYCDFFLSGHAPRLSNRSL